MALEIDWQEHIIRGNMRAFAERFIPKEQSGGLGLLNNLRAELGQRVHRQYAQKRQAEYGQNFQKEIPLTLDIPIADWRLKLRGRADGIIIDGETLILEEVKSLALASSQIDLLTCDSLQSFIDQLSLYALALQPTHPLIKLQLVLVSLQDEGQKTLPVDFRPSKLLAALTVWVQELSGQARKKQEEAVKRAAIAAKLRFPYNEIRAPQARLMEQIATGLERERPVVAMAPTGTGKTAAALFPALRSALQNNSRIWFTTAKRTQQEMACKTFLDIVKSSKLGRRLHALAMAPKEKMCPTGHLLCSPLVCPYLQGFQNRYDQSRLQEKLLSSGPVLRGQDLFNAGVKESLCPYEIAVRLCLVCDLIIADYNYLFDRYPFRGANRQENEAAPLVIIDEAHNLFDRVRKVYSPFLTLEQIQIAQNLCRLNCLKKNSDNQLELGLEEFTAYSDESLGRKILTFLDKVATFITDKIKNGPGEEAPRQEGCWQINASGGPLADWSEEAADLLIRYSIFRKVARLTGPMDAIQETFDHFIQICDLALAEEEEMVTYVRGSHGPKGMGTICLSPARRLSALHSRRGNTIAISATLSPLSYFADVLGLSPFNPLLVEVPSPFPPENRLVVIDPAVTTTFSKRDKNYAAIAEKIALITTCNPGNYVAFFPSFTFLNEVAKNIKTSTCKVIIQDHKMDETAREAVIRQLQEERGILLLAVMGGIFSEGVDLPGEALIGAIIVGPGLPQVGFERSLICKYFQDTREAGFAYGMLFPGMQKVIQAAGRVIRTMEDRGIVVLLDSRFGQQPYCLALPSWWYENSPEEIITSDLAGTLRMFWEKRGTGRPRIIRKIISDENYDSQYWPEYS